jgi:anaerobic selenocysteine-containing dehydrogenase
MALTRTPGEDGEHVTYCRICEALCGMVAKVENGKITKILPDRDNPHSQGHICVKGPALAKVVYDEDRVVTPLKRCGEPGEFEPVSWDEALDDIAARLSASLAKHGPDSFAMNTGNPPSMGWPSAMGNALFQQAMGCSKLYTPSSEDIASAVLATELLFGTHAFVFPDLVQCEHLLIFGSNPLVSHGSLLIAPRFKSDLEEIAARGRVIVVDPRRTETARKYEHVSIMPESDAWLLGAMIQVIVSEGLSDEVFIADHCTGWDTLSQALAWLTPEVAATRCAIPASEIRTLARDFARAERAAAMGRIGICRGSYATLTNVLLQALNVICGRFHRPGGVGWGHGGTATRDQYGGISPAAARGGIPSRVSNLPSVWGAQPSLTFLEEMITPGEGQIRTLLVSGANPVMSMPNGPRLTTGFAGLDLMVSLDLYVTETSRHAHYILPVTTALEREDINQFFMNHMVRPFAQHVDAVIPPVGEARGEWGYPARSRDTHWSRGRIRRRFSLRHGRCGVAGGNRRRGWAVPVGPEREPPRYHDQSRSLGLRFYGADRSRRPQDPPLGFGHRWGAGAAARRAAPRPEQVATGQCTAIAIDQQLVAKRRPVGPQRCPRIAGPPARCRRKIGCRRVPGPAPLRVG